MLLVILSFMAYYLRMVPLLGRLFHFTRSDSVAAAYSTVTSQASTASATSASASTAAATAAPSSYLVPRRWIDAAETRFTDYEELTVASYNILCQKFITAFHYPNCAKRFKTQEYRHYLLMMELDTLGADVYNLQEVSPAYFEEELRPAMESKGYAGHYQKKKGTGADGLATFYRKDRFEAVEFRELDLNEKANAACIERGVNPNQISVLHNTVALFGLLNLKGGPASAMSRPILFGNVHIHYDWTRNDVQALQIAFTVQALKEFAAERGNPPFVLCGDFNIQPTSPAYVLMTNGSWTEGDWRRGQNVPLRNGWEPKYVAQLLEPYYHHPATTIKSAYKTVLGNEPVTTNMTADFNGCLDYILYDSEQVEVSSILDLVDESVIKPLGGCPNQKFPSDHMALQAKLRFSKAIN